MLVFSSKGVDWVEKSCQNFFKKIVQNVSKNFFQQFIFAKIIILYLGQISELLKKHSSIASKLRKKKYRWGGGCLHK